MCFEPITPRSLPQLKGDGVLQHESGMPVVPARRLVLLAQANQHHDILNLVVPRLCGLDRFEACRIRRCRSKAVITSTRNACKWFAWSSRLRVISSRTDRSTCYIARCTAERLLGTGVRSVSPSKTSDGLCHCRCRSTRTSPRAIKPLQLAGSSSDTHLSRLAALFIGFQSKVFYCTINYIWTEGRGQFQQRRRQGVADEFFGASQVRCRLVQLTGNP